MKYISNIQESTRLNKDAGVSQIREKGMSKRGFKAAYRGKTKFPRRIFMSVTL